MASTATQFDTLHAASERQINVGSAERNLSLIGGGLLLLSGLRRGGFGGIARSLLGGSLLYRGTTGYCPLYSSLGLSTARPTGPDQDRSPGTVPAQSNGSTSGEGIKVMMTP